jgi:hypothetical protein
MTALSNDGSAHSPLFDLDPDALTGIPVRYHSIFGELMNDEL